MKTYWVMFGSSHLFGDFFDLIRDAGGTLASIVLNVPEKPMAGRPTLAERVARLPYKVDVLPLERFKPMPDCRYAIGFSRKIMVPLLEHLKSKHDLSFERLVHSTAVIQYGGSVAEGAVVNAGAILGSWAEIGSHVIVNRGANVGHDCQVGAYSFLAPGATLCSHVKIGQNVLVGAGAVILPDVEVGDDAVVGAGAVVLEDVPAGTMVAGVPSEIKRVVGRGP